MDFFIPVIFLYIISCLALVPYPLNLLYLTLKSRNYKTPEISSYYSFSELPTVAIHLPIYNEKDVILTTLENLLNLDYPENKLIIMILDDSTDETSSLIDEFLKNTKKFQIDVVRRSHRNEFKAGALAEATQKTSAEFIAIFDADCKVSPDFLMKTIHYFKDEKIGAVQTRWEHSNLHYSLFTLAMSVGLDGHFLTEKLGQMSTNSFVAFNGTGGLWRKASILEAGNWRGKTLAEDLDLAYRAQLQGKSIVYIPEVAVLQEIAPSLSLWGIQQTRWSRGFSQNIRLHFTDVFTKNHFKNRFQSAILLTAYLIPFFLLINIISSSLLFFSPNFLSINPYFQILNLSLGIVSISGLIVYSIAIIRAKRPIWHIFLIPLFLFWGTSLLIRIFFGILAGFVKFGGEFKRTPKFDLFRDQNKKVNTRVKMPIDTIVFIELLFLVYLGIVVYKPLALGIQMIFATFFFIFVFISMLFMVTSNITHFIGSK